MSEDGNLCTINSLRSQQIYSNCSQRDGDDVGPCFAFIGGESADEHEESGLVAHDRDVSLAR
jgi:hypothetical protein